MANVTDKDRGYLNIKKQLKDFNFAYTKIGVQDGSYDELKPTPPDKRHKRTDLVTIASANEFGTKNIPARPFIRSAYDMHNKKASEIIEKGYSAILQQRTTTKKVLKLVGQFMESKVKNRITEIKSPANDPKTIAKKTKNGKVGNDPLIDSGQLRQSIIHVERFG